MNTIQKATFAASALAITCLGAALVTAPMAFARPVAAVAQTECTAPAAGQPGNAGCAGFGGQLVALNAR
ncbi:MAG TPA: hypothetical protein VMU52_09525 [Steroidobacteraceae bacterium]|nr:hypothetical protein [Steroidobacteraceae bacterium]